MSDCSVECKQKHVIQCAKEEEEKLDPDECYLDEWERHADTYKNAFELYYESVSSLNSTDGEIVVSKWEKEQHPKLCCLKRHRCPAFIWL